ncbi:MAG: UDP-3-O-(3-hydroxymyristoyl)glucosamine N-acyltransferase [Bacteroides sp.]|nr:UDP-3-O-(3-hydroxymyristoyl)glucosamine N-acyltransferase [Bacteroides sp.]MCM1379805.1 UDP-3-O-(3-hydroxymyristoyl)glucosamine N-acyltransferase [Bacteroides sp.]MCM1446164.1 UDP-3-O-(3-hydroxymyristoyl)glucosamine N-acyltransferase [Prevotella sp.]
MEFSAQQIAEVLGGAVEGNPEVKLSTFDKIESAGPKALTFLSNLKYSHFIYTTNAGAVLVSRDFVPAEAVNSTLIRVDDPYAALAQLMRMVDALLNPQPSGIEQPSFIAADVKIPTECYVGAFAYVGTGAKLGEGVRIYPQVYVGPGVEIGEGTIIYAGAKIYRGCKIGKNCVIHAGVVIGGDGFGFAPNPDGTYNKIPQLGIAEIADNVEIGANTTVDRATMGRTYVGEGTKLDNLIQVAHNVEIGRNTVMASQVGIAGSTKVGDHCMVGGQVGIAGHITIGDNVNIGAQSGLHSNTASNQTIMGTPAINARKWMRNTGYINRIAELFQRVNKLEKKI